MNAKMRIPFVLNSKKGFVEVEYSKNESASESGFDLFESLGFDSKRCIGYPTIKASIQDYEGSGYYTASGWIQMISNQLFADEYDVNPVNELIELDVNPTFEALGVPFFALGYPAVLYDAPCDNLRGYVKSRWRAQTFMVTHPSRINNDTIEYILGFEWGYDEIDKNNHRHVIMTSLKKCSIEDWRRHLPLLKEKCPEWNFE